jgi:hypothetical protein
MKASSNTKKQDLNTRLVVAAWSLSALVAILAFIAWGASYQWRPANINAYTLFPLLGLVAFSVMWSHYIASVARQILTIPSHVLRKYFNVTSFIVLILICAHPGILIYQRYRDGFGLPPGSYHSYVAPGLGWITTLGSVCLLVFIAYEFRRKFKKNSWWRYTQYLVDAAMIGILYHSLKLGNQLQSGWLQKVWYFYGVSLVGCLIYQYYQNYKNRSI